jgi:hypothetical protein
MCPSTTNKCQKERKEIIGYAVKQTKKVLKKSKKTALKESTNETLNRIPGGPFWSSHRQGGFKLPCC